MPVWHLWSVLTWYQFLYCIFFLHYFSDLHAGKPFCLILRLDFLAFLPWGLTHAGSSVCHCQISIKFMFKNLAEIILFSQV